MNKPSFLFNHLYMPNTRIFSTFNSNSNSQPNDKGNETLTLGRHHRSAITNPSPNSNPNLTPTITPRPPPRNNSSDYLDRAFKKIAIKMDLVFETCLAQDTDFPICDSPVWVFGRSYSIHYGKDPDGKDLDELRRTVATCLWCTYRKNFPSIGSTGLTSDRGWGCMIRAGQMLMAKALILRHLGPNWHWESHTRTPTYLQIVSLFADVPTAPLSIHQISQSGVSLGKPVGSWLGPNTVAQALKKIVNSGASGNFDIELFISMDSTLIKSEVKRACLSGSLNMSHSQESHSQSVPLSQCIFSTPRKDPKWKPLMLVIPLRLGLSDLNSSYVPAFRAAFEVKQNIGIIGGRPNHALYFIGYAEDEVIFLDPHTVQASGPVGSKIFETEKEGDCSYHNSKPGRMPFASMDPSIAVCFYCETEEDFDNLCSKLSERFSTMPLPLFEICEKRPNDWTQGTVPPTSSIDSKKSQQPHTLQHLSTTSKSKLTVRNRKGHGPRSESTTSSEGEFENVLFQACASSSSRDFSPDPELLNKRSDEDDEFEILG